MDRLGREFKFKTEGEEGYTTILGGIISIIYYLGSIGLLCFFGKELIFKEDPNFIQRVDTLEKNPYQTLNNSNFFMAMGICDKDNIPLSI